MTFTAWYLGFVILPFTVFLFKNDILILQGHKSSNVSFIYKISSASCPVVLHRTRKYRLQSNPSFRSLGRVPSPLQLYSYELVTAVREQLANRQMFYMRKLIQPLPSAGTTNPKHNFLFKNPPTADTYLLSLVSVNLSDILV